MIKTLYKKISDQNLALNESEIRKGVSILHSKPIFFNLDLIGVCNMQPRCAMCYEIDSSARRHFGITISDILNFGEFFEKAGSLINCSIGEPLMHRDIVELIRIIDSRGKEIGLNTNGLGLTRDLSDRLLEYPEALNFLVSLDAASRVTYEKIRGKCFERVIENVSYFCARRKRVNYKKDGQLYPRIGFCFMPMKINKNEILSFVKLAAEIGVDRVELRCLNKTDKDIIIERDNFVFNYNEQMLSKDELDEVEALASAAARKHNVVLECQYRSERIGFDFFLPAEFRNTKLKCILPWRFILPYKNGETTGCCYMNKSLGDWRKHGLEKLWNGHRMRKMREELAAGELSRECLDYKHCPLVNNRCLTN